MAPKREIDQLTPQRIGSWLASNGWNQTGKLGDKATIWEGPNGSQLTVPLHSAFRDYKARIQDLLQILAEVEATTPEDILQRLLPTRLDLLKPEMEARYGSKEALRELIFGARQ